MGETYDQVDKEINRVAYKVVRGENNTPRVEIGDRKYSPQEISAMMYVLTSYQGLPLKILDLDMQVPNKQ